MDESFLTILKLVAVLLLVLANGYFVASEFSLVSVRRTRIDQLVEEGNGSAKTVQMALDHTDDFIAATQLGITMASLLLGWIGEPALAHLVQPLFEFMGLSETGSFWSAHGLSVVIAFSIITSLHIVIGELAPKTIALQASESTALLIARPLQIFLFLFRPFIFLMNGMGRFVVRLLGFEPASESDMIHSEEELRMLVRDSTRGGALEPHENELIQRVFQLDRIEAQHAMLPRTEMVAVSSDTTLQELLQTAADVGFTRYPVYRDNTDDIVGIVSVKTLMSLLSHWLGRAEEPPFNVVEHSEPPLFIHEAMPADDVLAEMSEHHTQMAIVVDEYGGTAGIVTREGLLDRLVGGVSEDPEDRNFDFEVISDDEVVLNGLLPVSEFEDRFHTKVDEDDYNTMGGLVFGRLGSAAQVGSTTTLEGFQAVVEEMDGLRIAKLRLHRTSEDQYMPAVQRSLNGAAPD